MSGWRNKTHTARGSRKLFYGYSLGLLLFFAFFAFIPTVYAPRLSPQSSPKRTPPRLRLKWSKPAPMLLNFSLSPSGDALALTYATGAVHLYNREGRQLWGVKFLRPPRFVSVADGGWRALMCEADGKETATARLMEAGKTLFRQRTSSPVTAAALFPEGDRAVVAEAGGTVHFIAQSGGSWETHPALLSEPARQVALSDRRIVLSYRGKNGVEARDMEGNRIWSYPGDSGYVYDLVNGNPGKRIGILAYRAGSGDGAKAMVLSSEGELLWKAPLEGMYPRMSMDFDGEHSAIGTTDALYSGTRKTYARKVALYDDQGNRLWEKGGLFFSPRLVGCPHPGPEVIALSSNGDLLALDDRGNIENSYRSADDTPYAQTRVSQNGRVLVALHDSHLLEYLRWEADAGGGSP